MKLFVLVLNLCILSLSFCSLGVDVRRTRERSVTMTILPCQRWAHLVRDLPKARWEGRCGHSEQPSKKHFLLRFAVGFFAGSSRCQKSSCYIEIPVHGDVVCSANITLSFASHRKSVFVPATEQPRERPVLVWFFGNLHSRFSGNACRILLLICFRHS